MQGRDTTARVMLLTLVPAELVIIQPDLGSGLVYIVIGLATLFVAGAGWRHFAALFALGAVAIALTLVVAPAMGVTVLHGYQKDRLTAFLSPSDNPAKQGYQQSQSRIAIGSGEKTGRGDSGIKTKLNFLPEHHTDFVFAVVGERWGFVDCIRALDVCTLLIWRGTAHLAMLLLTHHSGLAPGGIEQARRPLRGRRSSSSRPRACAGVRAAMRSPRTPPRRPSWPRWPAARPRPPASW